MVQANFHIDGPDQLRKKELLVELKNINFKQALVKFFIDNWAEDINDKTIYVNSGACFKFTVKDGKVVRTLDEKLTCPAHEEADTKMIFHICQLDFDAKVTIRCSDTDVLIIMLANMSKISKNIQVRMEVSVGNHQRFINVSKLYDALGRNVSEALPAFHALTGCDFNPAFFRKGKKRPFIIMRIFTDFTESFIQMSTPSDNREETFAKIEQFICKMYGFKSLKNINDVRLATFQKTYKHIDNDDVFHLPKKSIDGSALPSCKAELYQHFLRACYVAQMWAHAHLQVPIAEPPTNYGWIEIENKYGFSWFSGSQLSTTITEITIQPEEDDND
ncbi:uncharacterized protein LOC116417081 [Nasonia vitripennis]|uniref:Uncharacterized protein n=1 Tax=Nasonia vitripennis TaxID=7425 RepID=A0A7M7QDV0_NASVI|nr:uncharacterized protein LOC116417081 [Nasonia vitripennis]